MKMTKLFLDDVREPFDNTWFVVRNFHTYVSYIKKYGVPDVIAFDHDLGPTEPNGFDCATWLVGNCTTLPKVVIVHSYNIAGAKRIASLFKAIVNTLVFPYPCTPLKPMIERL